MRTAPPAAARAALPTPAQGARRVGTEEAPAIDWIQPPGKRMHSLASAGLSEMFAYHAVSMANTLKTSLVVFSRKGTMPSLLSHYRPDYPIFCFTEVTKKLKFVLMLSL